RQPVLERHAKAAAGGDVDHRIAVVANPRQKAGVVLGLLRRRAGAFDAGVQVQDRRAGAGGVDGLGADGLGADRQMRAHRRGVNRAGDGAADDHLAGWAHGFLLLGDGGPGRAAMALGPISFAYLWYLRKLYL